MVLERGPGEPVELQVCDWNGASTLIELVGSFHHYTSGVSASGLKKNKSKTLIQLSNEKAFQSEDKPKISQRAKGPQSS